MQWLFSIWVWLLAFLLSVPILSIFMEIPEEQNLPIRFLVAFLAVAIFLFVRFLRLIYHLPLEDNEETQNRHPQPPYEEEAEQERRSGPLQVEQLVLLVRGEDGNRLSLEVTPTDLAIRPYVEFYVFEEGVLGKQATMLFQIANPNRRTRFDWECRVPFTFKGGLNKVWPEKEEFSVVGQTQGVWRLVVSFTLNDTVFPWEEITFTLREELDLEVTVGADATISHTDRVRVEAAAKGRSVDDLLDEL